MNQSINEMSIDRRVAIGSAREDLVANCLTLHYGYNLVKASEHEDMVDKLDYINCLPNNLQEKCQIKSRMKGGDDILICLFQPFHGLHDCATKLGRDQVSAYDKYICLNKDATLIRVINGAYQKRIIGEVLNEWEVFGCGLPTFNSTKYSGVQIKFTTDACSGTPKLLMFIPPNVFPENEIEHYAMIG